VESLKMENIILGLALLHFALTFLGYSFLAWKVKNLRRRLDYLYGLVGALPLITSGLNLMANLPISTESMINFLILYFSGAIGGGFASTIIYNLENPRRRYYKPYKSRKFRRY
jgi:hypothetical protein